MLIIDRPLVLKSILQILQKSLGTMLVFLSGFAIPGLLRNIAVNYLANYLLDPDQRNQQDQVTSFITLYILPPKWRWIVDTINFPRSTPAHVFAKLPFVTFAISSLMCLTTVICMKVRFETKPKTRGFFSLSSPLHDSLLPLHSSLSLSPRKFSRKPLGPGTMKIGVKIPLPFSFCF